MSDRRRIYVTGGAGVGKTTLAKSLSEATGIPYFELDSLLWQDEGRGTRVPALDRMDRMHEISMQSEWIAKGVYVGWTQELWREADLIIFVDASLWLVLRRIFWRHLRAELRRNNRHSGWMKLFRFMRSVVRSHRSNETGDIDDDEDDILTRAKIMAKLQQHRDKALVVGSSPNIEKILSRMVRQ